MMPRHVLVRLSMAVLAALIVAAGTFIGYRHLFESKVVTAHFASAAGVYSGDEVRVAGVKVGTITSVQPRGDTVTLTMNIDRSVPIPADAKAVIFQQNLVAARYVQLAPAYESTGPIMADGAVIPIERTAVPVEWDDVKDQLMRLAIDLGPAASRSATPTGRFIDSAANAMDGNGDKLRQTLTQLSGVARILADGGGNIVDTIKHLQTFVTALRESDEEIVQFEGRLATLSSVLDGSRSSLDAALTSLSVAVGDVERFLNGVRDKTTEQVQRLANVTQNLVDHKTAVEQILHVTPTTLSNFFNMYDALIGTAAGVPSLHNFANPAQFICGAIAGVQGGNPLDAVKKCAEYLGPYLRLLNFNYLPLPINPFLQPTPPPHELIYSEPHLMPGAAEQPTAPPAPASLSDMLLPAERPPS
jgi:virulence factor Mce-like protein